MKVTNYGIGLIATTIDGCLNSGKNLRCDLSPLSLIAQSNRGRFESGAPAITLISGRSQPFVEAYANSISACNYCICEDGALAFHPVTGEIVYNPAINRDTIKEIRCLRSHLSQHPIMDRAAYIQLGKECSFSVSALTGGPSLEDLFEELKPLAIGTAVKVTCSQSAVNFLPRGIDKGSGIQMLARLEDMPIDNMLGIGNSTSDLPFLGCVGYTSAPQNAAEAVKRQVQHVSSLNFCEGVLDGICHHLDTLAQEVDQRPIN